MKPVLDRHMGLLYDVLHVARWLPMLIFRYVGHYNGNLQELRNIP